MRLSLRTAFVVVLSVLVLSACNPVKNLQSRERMTQLRSAANTYRKLMRWGHFDQAVQYLKTRDGTQEEPDLEDMSHYQISSYTIADQIVSDSEFDARVTAYIDFYRIDTGVALSVRDEQHWWYDEEQKRWFLGSPMVNFTAASASAR